MFAATLGCMVQKNVLWKRRRSGGRAGGRTIRGKRAQRKREKMWAWTNSEYTALECLTVMCTPVVGGVQYASTLQYTDIECAPVHSTIQHLAFHMYPSTST